MVNHGKDNKRQTSSDTQNVNEMRHLKLLDEPSFQMKTLFNKWRVDLNMCSPFTLNLTVDLKNKS